ncbi:MAG TPA: hypothetical protein VND91_02990 [Candidatus Saccharimonadia bacterium]|nr:hypothetical protein [Candidatus Saccharimonadia bacterium]
MTEAAKVGLFGRVDAMYRYLLMSYQLGVVSKAVEGFDRQDRRQLSELAERKTQAPGAELLRSSGEAFSRVRSSNTQMRLHAVAHWLGAAFLETRDSSNEDLQEIHRRVARVLRQLRETPRGARAAA